MFQNMIGESTNKLRFQWFKIVRWRVENTQVSLVEGIALQLVPLLVCYM